MSVSGATGAPNVQGSSNVPSDPLPEKKVEQDWEEEVPVEPFKDNDTLNDKQRELVMELAEIMLSKLPPPKEGELYTWGQLKNDFQALSYPPRSEQGLPQTENVTQQQAQVDQDTRQPAQAKQKRNDTRGVAEKIENLDIDYMSDPDADELTKSISDWNLNATPEKSKDEQLLTDVQELIDEIKEISAQFLLRKMEIKTHLNTLTAKVAAIEVYKPILQGYRREYVRISRDYILPIAQEETQFIAQLEQRIQQDSNARPSEKTYQTMAAIYEVGIDVLKKNIVEFHERTAKCKALKQKLGEESNKQVQAIKRFKTYYNYLAYCVEKGCYYSYSVIGYFEAGSRLLGWYNYIDQPTRSEEFSSHSEAEGTITRREKERARFKKREQKDPAQLKNEMDGTEQLSSTRSSLISTTRSGKGSDELDISELKEAQQQKSRQKNLMQRKVSNSISVYVDVPLGTDHQKEMADSSKIQASPPSEKTIQNYKPDSGNETPMLLPSDDE